jgi:hypothetical protein
VAGDGISRRRPVELRNISNFFIRRSFTFCRSRQLFDVCSQKLNRIPSELLVPNARKSCICETGLRLNVHHVTFNVSCGKHEKRVQQEANCSLLYIGYGTDGQVSDESLRA